jgi:predicted lipid-binding transport protein (Tim44 family)
MGLSEYDKKVLEQLELDLISGDDPLARKLSQGRAKPTNSAPKLIAGALIGLVGMSLVVFGAIAQLTVFGVIGFLVALTGILIASANPSSRASSSKVKQSASTKKGSFFEDRWDRRRDQS